MNERRPRLLTLDELKAQRQKEADFVLKWAVIFPFICINSAIIAAAVLSVTAK